MIIFTSLLAKVVREAMLRLNVYDLRLLHIISIGIPFDCIKRLISTGH